MDYEEHNEERDIGKLRRRGALICLSYARNLAYYTAAWGALNRDNWDNSRRSVEDELWVTVTGDILDICVLEWCKLFGDDERPRNRSAHDWRVLVVDGEQFKLALLEKLEFDWDFWEKVRIECRTYRDKFVSHLDKEKWMNIPLVSGPVLHMVEFLYEAVRPLIPSNHAHKLPTDFREYFDTCLRIGTRVFQRIAESEA